ncbi:Hypothetical predicted protein [Cloeon dipterum]|uniref:Spondin domain-containing protein n=1 Tax=Cloeon dipterum TaxID=197152 RepID=A0A8S1D4I6_9INSE|nr:Hypothetical predicted protein [Cloeon dipterum]
MRTTTALTMMLLCTLYEIDARWIPDDQDTRIDTQWTPEDRSDAPAQVDPAPTNPFTSASGNKESPKQTSKETNPKNTNHADLSYLEAQRSPPTSRDDKAPTATAPHQNPETKRNSNPNLPSLPKPPPSLPKPGNKHLRQSLNAFGP